VLFQFTGNDVNALKAASKHRVNNVNYLFNTLIHDLTMWISNWHQQCCFLMCLRVAP